MIGLVNSVGAAPAAYEQTKQTGRNVASFPEDAGSPPMWVRPQGENAEAETTRAVTPANFERFNEHRNVSGGDEFARAETEPAQQPGLGDRVDMFA